MDTAVIIVAAGRGSRMGGAIPKQWQMLAGEPVLAHTLRAFAGMRVVLVIHPEDRERAERLGVELVPGGETRDASVLAGLRALEGSGVARVLIHDGARPLVSPALIRRLIAALETHDGAAPALAVSDARATGLTAGRGTSCVRVACALGASGGGDDSTSASSSSSGSVPSAFVRTGCSTIPPTTDDDPFS